MDEPDTKGREGEDAPFELEDEPEAPTLAAPPPVAPPPPSVPAARSRARTAGAPAPAEKSAPPRAEEAAEGPLAFLDTRRRRRLQVYVPVMLVAYLLIGWFFAGVGLVWFALAGLLVGVFAAWRRRSEVLLGSVAAAAGFAASLLAVHFPLFFVVVPTGILGFLAGIDDRLRNS